MYFYLSQCIFLTIWALVENNHIRYVIWIHEVTVQPVQTIHTDYLICILNSQPDICQHYWILILSLLKLLSMIIAYFSYFENRSN